MKEDIFLELAFCLLALDRSSQWVSSLKVSDSPNVEGLPQHHRYQQALFNKECIK